jgi:phosphatidylserine/phosphatidylglycerophosphate/cardiolipin synthase-like enzyme
MGGIDLCLGRYEHQGYPISEPLWDQGLTMWPGKDYHNGNIGDYKDVRNYDKCLFDKESDKRMPRRDIAVMQLGTGVIDLSRHFLQFWNFIKHQRKDTGQANPNMLYIDSKFEKGGGFSNKNSSLKPKSKKVSAKKTQSYLIEDPPTELTESSIKLDPRREMAQDEEMITEKKRKININVQRWKNSITAVLIANRKQKGLDPGDILFNGCLANQVPSGYTRSLSPTCSFALETRSNTRAFATVLMKEYSHSSPAPAGRINRIISKVNNVLGGDKKTADPNQT